MSQKDKDTIEHYSECIDQLTAIHTKDLGKIGKLEDYLNRLQTICKENDIHYPPLEEPIRF
jgi:hypothetical protein